MVTEVVTEKNGDYKKGLSAITLLLLLFHINRIFSLNR